MTRDEVRARVHYKPAGRAPVCGFSLQVSKAVQAGTAFHEHAILQVRGTTDVRNVTCRACANWLCLAIAGVVERIED